MLVVWRRRAISFALVYQVSKVEDGTPSFEEEFKQDRDSMAETARKKWLAERLGNERAVSPLLAYLKDTEVG